MEPASWLLLGVLGAWAALDGAAAGQIMVSRPLVTGTVTGALLGEPFTGFQLGLLLEIAHLGAVPIGGARLPEPGPAAIPGAAAAVALGGGEGMALGLAAAMLLSVAGGTSMIGQRRVNGRLVEGLEEGRIAPAGLSRRLALSLGMEALRGLTLTLGGLLLVLALTRPFAAVWPLGSAASWALLGILLAYPAGILARGLTPAPGRLTLLAAGGAAGVVLIWWIQG